MGEIQNLDFDYKTVEGWDNSEGQSYNVWGLVDFPKELLDYLNEHKDIPRYFYDALTGAKILEKNKKSCIWTEFDDYLYAKHGKVSSKELPKISATFKSSFSKYGAVSENIAMNITRSLDMPSSYNYLVKFDPSQYPEIVKNYPNIEKLNRLQPYGIVSIDFLQTKPTKDAKKTTYISKVDGEEHTVNSKIQGDELITFEDALRRKHLNKLSGEENLIENWIDVVDDIAFDRLKDQPKELVEEMIARTRSRIARSFLLREFLGDCDFTAYNGGLVYNDETKKLNYAPNYDYGECFNALIKNKLEQKNNDGKIFGMTKDVFETLPKELQEKLLAQNNSKKEKTINEIAKTWASGTSEENFKYVIKNFPKSSREFFENLDHLIQGGEIHEVMQEYKDLTCNGKRLLTDKEIEMYEDYLLERSAHLSQLYVDYLKDNNKEIPQSIIER